jgi:uncharacterized coiled-coil protein SlyX
MDLDRGTLARIDRKVVSGLDDAESYRMVRLPVSEATWSTWKRYCDAAGISMGRAVIGLIGNELRSVVAGSTGDEAPLFAGLAEERLASREAQIAARERAIEEAEKRLSEWTKRLRTREGELRMLERQVRAAPAPVVHPAEPRSKVGRNERCPCKSGLKYKHCHGLAGRAGQYPDNG